MPDWTEREWRRIEAAMGIPQYIMDMPIEKPTSTEVQIGRPKGVLFYCEPECMGLPGIVPAGHFDTSDTKEPDHD